MEDVLIDRRNRLKAYNYEKLSIDRQMLEYYEELLPTMGKSTEIHKQYDLLKVQTSERLQMSYRDLHSMHHKLKEKRRKNNEDPIYLYQLMKLSVLELPEAPSLVRSPELEAKMERLRLRLEEEEYKKMTKNVSNQTLNPNESLGKDLRKMDSSIGFLFNFVLTVLGSFVFAYKAVEYSLREPNVSLQLMAGMTVATVVFFADIYFIIKDYERNRL